jgi:hypothetical protein
VPTVNVVRKIPILFGGSRDSAVGIATGYGLNYRGGRPGRIKNFLFPTSSRRIYLMNCSILNFIGSIELSPFVRQYLFYWPSALFCDNKIKNVFCEFLVRCLWRVMELKQIRRFMSPRSSLPCFKQYSLCLVSPVFKRMLVILLVVFRISWTVFLHHCIS